jgi:hypothetical protein
LSHVGFFFAAATLQTSESHIETLGETMAPPGDRQRPVLQLKRSLVARQHDVGGLVEQGSHRAVAAFENAAGVVDLAGLIAARHQTQVRLTMTHDAIDAVASFRFSAGIARRWHKAAELALDQLSQRDGCAVL